MIIKKSVINVYGVVVENTAQHDVHIIIRKSIYKKNEIMTYYKLNKIILNYNINMGNFTSTTTFNSEVYEQIITKIPESVNNFIELLNGNSENFEQDKLEPLCRKFINNLINSSSGLDEVYIGGLSAGLTSYMLSLKPTDSKYKDDIENYIKVLVEIINKQKI